MATSLIPAFFASASLQIKDQNSGLILATNLKTSKVSIRMSAEGMRHLMEDGSTLVDCRVLRPTKIIMDVICPDLDTLDQINEVLMNRTTIFQITSRGLIIPQMIIEGETIKLGPEMISATPIRISMQQFMLENVSPIVMANPADASLLDKGMGLVDTAKTSISELYDKAASAATSLFG